MRKFIADTCAMIIFSLVVGMFIELVLSKMTLEQSIQSRLIAMPVNLLTGGLYGKYSDWLILITKAKQRSWIVRTLVDIGAFVSFQAPLYAAILLTTGATEKQIYIAVSAATVSLTLLGGPYGRFLAFVRRRCGVEETT